MANPPHRRAEMRALYPVCQVAELAAGYRDTTQAREIQELHRAGLQLGEPYTSHGSCLLSLSRDIRGASYQKESGINSIVRSHISAPCSLSRCMTHRTPLSWPS